MRIIIGGDICPTESNMKFFEEGNIEALVGCSLIESLKTADFRIANLECPLTDEMSPIEKCGPNLYCSTTSVNGLKALGIDFFTLANNHILDQDNQGLYSTINILSEANIAYAGAGNNLSEAEIPYVLEKDGIKVGIYCCAEHEFTIAGKNKPGANPFEPLYSLDHIHELKQRCNYVIVLYHGLKEYYRFPTPKLQQTLRRVIDKGADLVICQHSHCIGCEEDYNGGKIIYGQGNFIFDNDENEFWNSGLLIDITINNKSITYGTPIVFVKENHTIHIADGDTACNLLSGYYERSSHVNDTDYLHKKYSEFVRKMIPMYLRAVSGHYGNNIVMKAVNFLIRRKLHTIIYNRYTKQELMVIQNFIECECHQELLIHGLKDMVK